MRGLHGGRGNDVSKGASASEGCSGRLSNDPAKAMVACGRRKCAMLGRVSVVKGWDVCRQVRHSQRWVLNYNVAQCIASVLDAVVAATITVDVSSENKLERATSRHIRIFFWWLSTHKQSLSNTWVQILPLCRILRTSCSSDPTTFTFQPLARRLVCTLHSRHPIASATSASREYTVTT